MKSESNPSAYYRAILDTMPIPVFVVDDDVRILDFNVAAGKLLAADRSQVLRERGGEVLNCIHATETPQGCGHSRACGDCVIRNSVRRAFRGERMQQQKTRMEIQTAQGVQSVEMLITAAPVELEGEGRALLILEDVTELSALRELIPICSRCKAIRDDRQYWQRLESYLHSHLQLNLTHGVCPQCMTELYPDLYPKIVKAREQDVPAGTPDTELLVKLG